MYTSSWMEDVVCLSIENLKYKFENLFLINFHGGMHFIYFGYGDVPSGRISIFKILV